MFEVCVFYLVSRRFGVWSGCDMKFPEWRMAPGCNYRGDDF